MKGSEFEEERKGMRVIWQGDRGTWTNLTDD